LGVERVEELCNLDIPAILIKKVQDKTFISGLAETSLNTIKRRASIFSQTKKPVIYHPIPFPAVSKELFFDLEGDPTQGFIYLHGIYVRSDHDEQYISFVAKDYTPKAEKEAWKKCISFIQSLPEDDFCLYYYSHYEPTTYKLLQKQYTDVLSEKDIETLFDSKHAIDLYKVIRSNTDWPLYSYSLKEIAHFLNFNWRDKTPSGALSIQWFNEYLKDKDPDKLQRIIEYNEDDCKATMVVKDYLSSHNHV
ncbi:TM0106 family RecB-like putative nuclease, partial [Candidatus Gottesmanbacteria bacterium]|nr:TM0106 family RecB-like putative nuclease [Candidatus Gottesmanbacteria bacterium]